MKRIALAFLLAAAPAAQSCTTLGTFRWDGETWNIFQYQTLHAQFFQRVEFVPIGGTIAAVLIYHTEGEWYPYGETHVTTDNYTGTRFAAPCEAMTWRTVGCWWDDRANAPQPGDRLRVPAPQGTYVDLVQFPTGFALAGSVPWPVGDLRIERAYRGHWNQAQWRPAWWAVAVVPDRGWW